MISAIRHNRRLSVVVLAFAVLCGLAAWRLSDTAQAHRAHQGTPRALAGTHGRPPQGHRGGPGTDQPRIQPGGRMQSTVCFVIKAGIDGSPARLVPGKAYLSALQDCRPLCPGGSPETAHVMEIFGGSFREALPAEPSFAPAAIVGRTVSTRDS